jgi:hypothetical protein
VLHFVVSYLTAHYCTVSYYSIRYCAALQTWQSDYSPLSSPTTPSISVLSHHISHISLPAGLWETSGGGFLTHTHFLSTKEWEILKGFSKRGLFFARKFSTKKTPELLDMIDSYMLFNTTSEAGLYWPGFFKTDTTTPGKQWVQAHRERKRLENAELKARKHKKRQVPLKVQKPEISLSIAPPPPQLDTTITVSSLQAIDPLDQSPLKEGGKKRKKGLRRTPRGPKTQFDLLGEEKETDPHVEWRV